MLSLLRRKPKVPILMMPPQAADPPVRRNRQQNIKASEDCLAAFAALAEAYGLSKAALFEDMVAERLETAQRRGVKLEVMSR